MKLFIVNGTHFTVPGRRTSAHLNKPAADAAALDLVNDLRRDIAAVVADMDGGDPIDFPPIANPEDWQAALREAQALRIHAADGLEGEPADLADYDDDEIADAAECDVWIEEHDIPAPDLFGVMIGFGTEAAGALIPQVFDNYDDAQTEATARANAPGRWACVYQLLADGAPVRAGVEG